MRKLLFSFLLVTLLTQAILPLAWANSTFPTIYIDNEPLELTSPPLIEKGITFLPARTLLNKFSLNVQWNNKTREISAKNDDYLLKLTIGNTTVVVNEEEAVLAVAPRIVNGVAWLPLRSAVKIFEYDVVFDRDFNLISVAPEKEQSTFAVLLNVNFYLEQNLEGITKTHDSNSWEFKKLIESASAELEEKYTYEIDDIGVLELVDGQAEVGVTLIRSKPEVQDFQPTTNSYIYKVKKQKNGVWRIYDILPGTEADPVEPNPA
jgi:hypothetical protein